MSFSNHRVCAAGQSSRRWFPRTYRVGKVGRSARCFLLLACGFLPAYFVVAEPHTGIPPIELKQVAQGFKKPVHVEPYPDGSGRLAVVEQAGRMYLVLPGEKPGEVLLDIRKRVKAGGEKGLLSVAFHPDFGSNRQLYVNYTTKNGGLKTVVSEFRVGKDVDRVETWTERILLSFAQPWGNHNGGYVAFGPDGYFYIGNGDGGAANDPKNAGQRLDTWLGKILRIDVNRADAGKPYAIPGGNPFIDRDDVLPEIYAYGLRNPWRFSWDRKTRDLYVADVGQNRFEEIDIVTAGGNYGWRVMEGTIRTPGIDDEPQAGYIDPIAEYGRDDGVSITGGYVYRGSEYPDLQGVYFYADFASGNLWCLRYNGDRVTEKCLMQRTKMNITSFGETEQGELLVVDYKGGIYRIVQETD